METRVIRLAATVLLVFALAGCGRRTDGLPSVNMAPESGVAFSMQKIRETERFIYYGSDLDAKVLDNIDKTLTEKCPKINEDLEQVYSGKIPVYIYPDQKSYDGSISDKSVAGSPACSGEGKIHMVSPKSPIHVEGIPYSERLMMAVHEYVHLMVDQINDSAPMWLDEGLASFMGSADGYETVCRMAFARLPEIDFAKLENAYYDTSAADVYSCAAVRYIIENFGLSKLKRLLRKPEEFEEILSIAKGEFNTRWHSYIQNKFL